MCVCLRVCVHADALTRLYMHMCVHACMHVGVCVLSCMHVCFVHVFIVCAHACTCVCFSKETRVNILILLKISKKPKCKYFFKKE